MRGIPSAWLPDHSGQWLHWMKCQNGLGPCVPDREKMSTFPIINFCKKICFWSCEFFRVNNSNVSLKISWTFSLSLISIVMCIFIRNRPNDTLDRLQYAFHHLWRLCGKCILNTCIYLYTSCLLLLSIFFPIDWIDIWNGIIVWYIRFHMRCCKGIGGF